ncbi:MAG TPA: hypothetical protein VJZ06_06180 [Mobilitalea sp.]|nr:hypothetical protein [Mobilitalea sp.]
MKKLIKVIAICISFILTSSTLPMEVLAANESEQIVQPMYINITSYINSFNIDPDGQANVYTYVSSGTADKVAVVVFLEKYNNGYWSTINSWSDSRMDSYAYAIGHYYVVHGQYRIRSYCYTYINGAVTDYDSFISDVKTY